MVVGSDEASQIEAARYSFGAYCQILYPRIELAYHHLRIIFQLHQIEQGTVDRAMFFLPPRRGKTLLCSQLYLAWYLGKHPDRQVIFVSYNQQLADDSGRRVRDLINDPYHQRIFPECRLMEDSSSIQRLFFTRGGVYFAVGVGGPITGRGAHLLIIDDPIKDKEQARSDLERMKLHEWYSHVAYTRLMPKGAIVIINCMAGDTPILMADGKQKLLRDIRSGDIIASYDNGRLSAAKVLKWKNQGPDCLFTIRTSSGITVRANERHPFLVERGGNTKWTQLKDLRIGDRVLQAIGENGVASAAHMTGVTSRPSAKDIAPLTTTKLDGQVGTDRHRSIPDPKEQLIYGTDIRSISTITSHSLKFRKEDVPSAVSSQSPTSLHAGAVSCALTMTQGQERSEGCFATTVISRSGMERQKMSYFGPLDTFEIIPDSIVEITESGREDVFDIQVEGTESFIGNGLICHNTRWHEDDLSGWLLHDHTDEKWSVLSLPDIAEEDEPDFGNIEGRKEGEPLWPERFPLEVLHRIRNAIGSDAWNCLHQQRPGTREGNMFKREWLDGQYREVQWPARDMNKYILVDPASEKKKSSDYTAMMVVGLSSSRRYHVLDMVRDRLTLTQRADKLFELAGKWKPRLIGYEQYGLQADITYIKERSIQENRPLAIVPLGGAVGKIGRVERLVPLFELKRITLPLECWRTDHSGEEHDLVQIFVKSEYMSFPASRHDDMIDSLARIVDPEFKTVFPQSREEEQMERQQESIYHDERSWLSA